MRGGTAILQAGESLGGETACPLRGGLAADVEAATDLRDGDSDGDGPGDIAAEKRRRTGSTVEMHGGAALGV